jgi:hypothetical protein
MQSLASDRVRVAVVASADQSAAVGMMLRMDSGLDAEAIMEDVRLVTDGRVSPVLIWEKHPLAVLAGLMLILIVLLMLRRLFFPKRRTATA